MPKGAGASSSEKVVVAADNGDIAGASANAVAAVVEFAHGFSFSDSNNGDFIPFAPRALLIHVPLR